MSIHVAELKSVWDSFTSFLRIHRTTPHSLYGKFCCLCCYMVLWYSPVISSSVNPNMLLYLSKNLNFIQPYVLIWDQYFFSISDSHASQRVIIILLLLQMRHFLNTILCLYLSVCLSIFLPIFCMFYSFNIYFEKMQTIKFSKYKC